MHTLLHHTLYYYIITSQFSTIPDILRGGMNGLDHDHSVILLLAIYAALY